MPVSLVSLYSDLNMLFSFLTRSTFYHVTASHFHTSLIILILTPNSICLHIVQTYVPCLKLKTLKRFNFMSLRVLLEDPRTSVDTVEKKGHTALHLAALKGNCEIMKVLLEMTKVDVNAVDEAGCTALHVAGLGNVCMLVYE